MAELDVPLNANEELLWQGKPDQGIILRRSDWLTAALFLPPALFALRSLLVDGNNQSLWSIFVISMIIASSLYATIGRWLLDASIRGGTSYTLTSQRIIIRVGPDADQVASHNLASLSQPRLCELKKDGAGTISFRRPFPIFDGGLTAFTFNGIDFESEGSFRARNGRPSANLLERSLSARPPEFRAIPDAAKVYEKIMQARTAPATAPSTSKPGPPGIAPEWYLPR